MRVHILIALLGILTLFTGCGTVSVSGGRTLPNTVDFRTGTQGLVMRFLPGTPPPALFESDPLGITVEVTNKGTTDVSDGRLYLGGYDASHIRFDRDRAVLDQLPGKSQFNPEGLFSNTFDFNDPSVSMPDNTDVFPQVFKATACYHYRTQTSANICVDPDPYSIQLTEKVCTVQPVSFSGGQGAPIAVTRVEQQVTHNRMQFKIYIQNAGAGTVIDPSKSIDNCHEFIDRRDIDKVQVRSVEFSGNEIVQNCNPQVIRLNNGQGVTSCIFDGNLGPDAFRTILNLVFDYGYRNSITTKVDIHEIQ